MGFSGINALIDVTMAKVDNANNGDRPPPPPPPPPRPRQQISSSTPTPVAAPPESFFSYSPLERRHAILELERSIRIMRNSLSPSGAALLDLWIEWAESGGRRDFSKRA